MQSFFWDAGQNISCFFKGFLFADRLTKENEVLLKENQKLFAEIAQFKSLEKENEVLRNALGLNLKEDFDLVLSQVISKDPWQDYLLINAGKNEGLKENLPVITPERILLGRIDKVYDDFSRIILVSNTKSIIDVEIQDRDTYGLAKGEGGFKVLLDLLPKEKEVREDDIVVTSVLGGSFPQGILLGQLKNIEKQASAPFQRAEILPFFNLQNLNYVFIIKNFETL